MSILTLFFKNQKQVGEKVTVYREVDVPVYDGRVVKGREKITGTVIEDIGKSEKHFGIKVYHNRDTGERDDRRVNLGDGYYRIEIDD